MFPKRVRIVADGSRYGTRIFDADTNEEITNSIASVEFEHQARDTPKVRVVIVYWANNLEIDVTANAGTDVSEEMTFLCAPHEPAS